MSYEMSLHRTTIIITANPLLTTILIAIPTIEDKVREEVHKRVEQKYLEDYAWFAHRVRRSIPPPKDLEAALVKVLTLTLA